MLWGVGEPFEPFRAWSTFVFAALGQLHGGSSGSWRWRDFQEMWHKSTRIASYHYNAICYVQNRPTYEFLHRIWDLEQVARDFEGLMQPHELRPAGCGCFFSIVIGQNDVIFHRF